MRVAFRRIWYALALFLSEAGVDANLDIRPDPSRFSERTSRKGQYHLHISRITSAALEVPTETRRTACAQIFARSRPCLRIGKGILLFFRRTFPLPFSPGRRRRLRSWWGWCRWRGLRITLSRWYRAGIVLRIVILHRVRRQLALPSDFEDSVDVRIDSVAKMRIPFEASRKLAPHRILYDLNTCDSNG